MTQNQSVPDFNNQPKKLSHRHLIKWLLLTAFSLCGLLLLVLIIWANSFELQATALAAGIILATIPVPLYAALILRIDRYEHEPRYLLYVSFLWGGTASIFAALIINTFVQVNAGKFSAAVISAPIVEEISKAIIVFAIFFVKNDEFNDIVDGVVYASITALGFAMVENFSYYGRAFAGILPVGALGVFITRGVENPFLHPFLTSMTGIGLGLAAQTRNKFVRVFAPLTGLGLAIFFHSVWNFSSFEGVFNYTYYLLMVPTFWIIIAVLQYDLRREKKIICEQLLTEVNAGRLTQTEYEQLTCLHCRCKNCFHAFFTKGIGGWNAQRKCNQAATELAFVRQRAAQGFSVDPAKLTDCESVFSEYLKLIR